MEETCFLALFDLKSSLCACFFFFSFSFFSFLFFSVLRSVCFWSHANNKIGVATSKFVPISPLQNALCVCRWVSVGTKAAPRRHLGLGGAGPRHRGLDHGAVALDGWWVGGWVGGLVDKLVELRLGRGSYTVLTHSLTHSPYHHALTHTLTHSLTHSHPHALT